MNEHSHSILGKLVTIFIKDNMEFSGMVEDESTDKIVLSTSIGYLIVYKQNILGILIMESNNIAGSEEEEFLN